MNINEIKEHWYASIYDQQENQTYDVDLLLSILSDNQKGFATKRILEVCCGGGRILVPLAKAGYDVVGFDMDKEMMSMIPDKIGGMTNIEFYRADALKSDWGNGYDVVVLAGNIMINIVTECDYKEAQEIFIRKAADALKIGGHIYLDFDLLAHPENFFNSSSDRVHFEGYDNRGVYGRAIGCGGTYDTKTQMTDGKGRIEITLQNGETFSFEKKSIKHIPTLAQVHEWLTLSGFVIEQEYGDCNRNCISETTSRAIIYARKER